MPACPVTISASIATDALIGVTTTMDVGTTPVAVPHYGDPGSICSPLPQGYTSITRMTANAQRNSNKILRDTTIQNIVKELNICSSNTTFDKNQVDTCIENDSIFIKNMGDEYKYNYELYKYAIGKLTNALTLKTVPGWSSQQKAVNAYKAAAIQLNQNCNDITQIVDGISKARKTMIPTLTQQLNQLDESLQGQAQKLLKQQEILSSAGQNNMLLMKEMEAYSRHKSKYHNNMLMFYSFLNITALGLLFYVYRST
jgi:hypothetical protein